MARLARPVLDRVERFADLIESEGGAASLAALRAAERALDAERPE